MVDKHGVLLYNELKKLDKKVFFVYGKTTTETREKIRSIVEKEKDSLIIASYGTFSTGINIRNINNVVFASPSKSKSASSPINRKRGLSQSETKTSVKLFDVSDNISYKSRQNFTYRHFNERLNIYKQENFNYEISRVKSMNYQMVKLSNGEDIICNVDNEPLMVQLLQYLHH